MPLYEYYCVACEDRFEVLRPMDKAGVVEVCPEGHAGARRVLSTFATVGGGEDYCVNPAVLQGMSACCGGGCGVGHNH